METIAEAMSRRRPKSKPDVLLATEETVLQYLRRKLREAGSARWEAIAAQADVKKSLLRKLAYEDRMRENPGIAKIQPLLTYFREVETGMRELPALPKSKATNGA